MFIKKTLDIETNLFDELLTSTEFDDVIKGRQGAVLVDYKNEIAPIVRTTTSYNNSAQRFLPIHYDIISKIKEKFKDVKDLYLNNALIEVYESIYYKMGFHTDQSLDLKKDSYICLFSCYENETIPKDVRKLQIKNKTTKEVSEVSLDHNSVVLFSTSTNQEHVHKIVLDQNSKSTNRWLGITFRLSDTFIKFNEGVPYIYPSDKVLRMATTNDKKEFYKHKSSENSNSEYEYPKLEYTISESDIMPVK
jgi:hypothetical protein